MSDTEQVPVAEYEQRAQLLVDVLRSGEFVQGRGALCRVNLLSDERWYCVLGVACEVYHRETGDGDWVESCPESSYLTFGSGEDTRAFELPDSVRDWFGFTTGIGCLASTANVEKFKAETGEWVADLINSPHQMSLALSALNDDSRQTPFPILADLIEQRPPGLFRWGYGTEDPDAYLSRAEG